MKQQHHATITGRSVAYWTNDDVADASARVVILLHGLGGDHRGLEQVATDLTGFRVILPDFPGFGFSQPLTERHTVANYAAWLERLREHLQVESFHLVGHSFGAVVGTNYAGLYPNRVHRLSLLNPVTKPTALSGRLGKLYHQIGSYLPAPLAKFWVANRLLVYSADSILLKNSDRRRRRQIIREDYQNYRRANGRAIIEGFLSGAEAPDNLPVAAPVQIIASDHDHLASPAVTERIAAQFTNCQVVMLPDAGHLVPMEASATVAGPLREFLAAS